MPGGCSSTSSQSRQRAPRWRLLVGGWLALQVLSLCLASQRSWRRIAIAVLLPIPLLAAATQIPAGVLLYLLVSSAFGVAQKLALRAAAPAPSPAPA